MPRGTPNPRHLGLPSRLKKARKAAGLSGQALARAAAVSHPGKIEEGATVPRIDATERLAAALNISPCYLAFGLGSAEGGTRDGVAKVSERLKDARLRAGLSCNALGKQGGVSGQTVANIEDKGMMPGVDTAEQLAKALDVSPCWLAFGEGRPAGDEAQPKREKPTRCQIMTRAEAEDIAGEDGAADLMRLVNGGGRSKKPAPPPPPKRWSHPELVELMSSWLKSHRMPYSIQELPPGLSEEAWSRLRMDCFASHFFGRTVVLILPPTRKEDKGA